jgi:hypothetical protein
MNFSEEAKRKAFVPILSPLAAGPEATPAQEESAVPKIPGTIPIHADFAWGLELSIPLQHSSGLLVLVKLLSLRKSEMFTFTYL